MKRVLTTAGTLAVGGVAVWLSWSCKEDTTQTNTSVIVFPDSNVSYSKQVQPLFDRGCGSQVTQCHSTETYEVRGYSLDSWDHAVLARTTIIYRGRPDASLLVLSIDGRSTPRMPLSLPPLNDNQIKGIRRWITENAPDN